jgi:hypothetical protein
MGGEPRADLREDTSRSLAFTLSALVRTTWKVTAAVSRRPMISSSTGLMPWRASISTKARRSVARPAR